MARECKCKDCVHYIYDEKLCNLHKAKMAKDDSCSYATKIKLKK